MQRPRTEHVNARSAPRKYAVLAAKLALTGLVTWFVLRSVGIQFAEIGAVEWASVRVDILLLAASFAVLFGELGLAAWLWAKLVRRLGGPSVPTTKAAAVLVLANFGRYVPGKVLHIAGVAVLAERVRCPAPVAAAASLLSQMMHLLGAVVVGGWVVLQLSGLSLWAAVAAGTVLLILVAGLTCRGRMQAALVWAVQQIHRRRRSEVEFDAASVTSIALLPWLATFAAKWLVYGLAFFLFAKSMGAEGSFVFFATVFASAYLAGYVAVFAPAGVGVREASMIALLEPTLGASASVLLAVAQRAWITAFELIGAPGSVAVLWRRSRSE